MMKHMRLLTVNLTGGRRTNQRYLKRSDKACGGGLKNWKKATSVFCTPIPEKADRQMGGLKSTKRRRISSFFFRVNLTEDHLFARAVRATRFID